MQDLAVTRIENTTPSSLQELDSPLRTPYPVSVPPSS